MAYVKSTIGLIESIFKWNKKAMVMLMICVNEASRNVCVNVNINFNIVDVHAENRWIPVL